MRPYTAVMGMRVKIALLIALGGVLAWSGHQPRDTAVWWMEAAPVLLAVPLLIATRHRFPLTDLAYALIWFHAVILLVGAHYTYAEVPAFDWLADVFGWTRNHYDRLGHFAQGFVPALIARELLIRTSPLRPGAWLFTLVVLATLGISATYELIEWLAAELSADGAVAFLGTQGDGWDTQKDMAWALVGAVLAMTSLGRWHDRQLARMEQTSDRP